MFKDRLKELREKNGISQYQLAEMLYVSRSAIAKWENGKGIPSDVNIDALCKLFNVKKEWLLDQNNLKIIVNNKSNNFIKIKKYHLISLILSFLLVVLIYYDNFLLIRLNEYGLWGIFGFAIVVFFTFFILYLFLYLICYIFYKAIIKKFS